jgi:hypothetical protein
MQIDIRSNLQDVMRDLDAMERLVLPKALNKSMNRIGTAANKIIIRGVSKEAGLTQSALKKRGFFSNLRSNVRTLTFSIMVKWGSIPLKDFNPRQTKLGVTAKAWGSRKVYDGAFIVDKLGRHVFVRKTDRRLPIKKLYGPIPARLAEQDSITNQVESMIAERITREVDANIKYYANRQLALSRR